MASAPVIWIDDEDQMLGQLIVAAGSRVWDPKLGLEPSAALIRIPQRLLQSRLLFIRTLRMGAPHLPIIAVCPGDEQTAVLAAFEAGADDVVTEQVDPQELGARVRVWMRRVPPQVGVLIVADLAIDASTTTASRAGEFLSLTATEFGLLFALARRQGENVSRDVLGREVWGRTTVDDNLLDAHMSRLRRKVHARGTPLIHTIYGVGYRLGV
jgi:DNA-binding response OmpR family regulator